MVFENKKQPSKALVPVGKPLFGYWRSFFHAFYDAKLYLDVAHSWRGMGMTYLFLLLLIVCLPLGFQSFHTFKHQLDTQLIEPLERLPVLPLENGQLMVHPMIPELIKNSENQVVGLISPLATKELMESGTYPHLVVLVNQDTLFIRYFSSIDGTDLTNSLPNIVGLPLAGFPDNRLDGKQLLKDGHVYVIQWILLLLFYPALVSFIWGLVVTIIDVIAMMGQVCARYVMKVNLSYFQACRVLSVAATPAIVLWFIVAAFNVHHSLIPFFILGILVLYFVFAVHTLKYWTKEMIVQ